MGDETALSARVLAVERLLVGIPGDKDHPGLWRIVERNQEQIDANTKAIGETQVALGRIDQILRGINGDGGLLDRVRENTRFRRLVERFGLWLAAPFVLAGIKEVIEFVRWGIQQYMGSGG